MSNTRLSEVSTNTTSTPPEINPPPYSSKSKAKQILTAPFTVLRYVFPEIDYTSEGITKAKNSIDKRRKSQTNQLAGQVEVGESSDMPPPYEPGNQTSFRERGSMEKEREVEVERNEVGR